MKTHERYGIFKMTEIEKLKKEIEGLKLIIESKNNQVESKNKHIKRLRELSQI